MSAARKDLELRMTVTADASRASQAMQQLTRDAERAGLAVKSLNAGPSGPGPSSSPGLLGRAAGIVSSGAGYVAGGAALISTIAGVHKAFLDLDSGLLTVREKTLGFAKAIPLVGDAISSFLGNLMDARDRMLNPGQYANVQRMRAENPVLMAQAGARHEFSQRAGGLRREVGDAGLRAQSVRDFPTIASGQALLTGSVGGMAGSFLGAGMDSIDPRLMAAMEAIQDAKRGQSAAANAAGASLMDVDGSRTNARRAMADFQAAARESRSRLEAAQGGGVAGDRSDRAGDAAYNRFGFESNKGANYLQRFGNQLGAATIGTAARAIGRLAPSRVLGGSDPGTNLSLQEAALTEQKKAHEAALATADLEAKMTTNKERQLALAQKSHELAKAETNLMRVKVSLLDEEYAKAKGGAQQFGSMDAMSQDALLQVARRFKEGGRENVTEGEFNMLQGNALTRDMVGKRAEQDASASPVFKELEKLLGIRGAEEIKQERDKLKTEVDMKVQFDEEKFATMMESQLKKLNLKDLLGEIFKSQLELKLRDPERGMLAKKAGEAG